MTLRPLHRCQCPHCQVADGHPDQLRHHQMNLFLSWLNEQQRRWYVALEAKRIGHGGDLVVVGDHRHGRARHTDISHLNPTTASAAQDSTR